MKKRGFLIVMALVSLCNIWADELPQDSLKVVDVEEIVVIGTPKENRKMRELPAAVTLLSQKDMQANQVTSIKGLSALVPSIYIPDYGSKLTSAIYIRGVGSRINTPSVGLYVDNVPYIDKSAFDFNYADIERIDVLRGPQATLYGRNTMGGLIRVHTKSPFSYQGTDIKLGAATYGTYNASLTHYHRISEKFAFSVGGFYDHANGFFKNTARDNKKVDWLNAAGGRIRSIFLPSDNVKLDFNVNYEYNKQGGYPYAYTGKVFLADGETDPREDKIGKVSYNDESTYRRNLFNANLNVVYQGQNYIFNAVTGYQYLNDRMFLDQDFTEKDIFNLDQRQKLNVISEEIVFKSKPGSWWEWTTGAFGFYQWLKTNGPVTFKGDGVQEMIQDNINNNIPNMGSMGSMSVDITTRPLYVSGHFDTPIFNGALFHQSIFRIVEGFTATVGLRLDYERTSMTYNSGSQIDYDFNMESRMLPTPIKEALSLSPALSGKFHNNYLQLLPKFALQYEWKQGSNVYATISRGYRSGGYNVQMFSDLIQTCMENGMKGQIKETITNIFNNMQGMPPAVIEGILSKIPGAGPDPDVKEATIYKPEYTWNYEIGVRLNLFDNRLIADGALFYMDTRDQQVAKFAESGLGRITTNAGKSRSYGLEATLRAGITNGLSVHANYGYTHATFRDYETNEKVNGQLETLDYTGNYVPFVPQHTLSVGGQYIWRMSNRCTWLDRIQFNLNYNAAGRIYWTESNSASQSFYGTMDGRISFEKSKGAIAFWVRNALDKDYQTFYFESLGNGFMQRGCPRQFGVEIRCNF